MDTDQVWRRGDSYPAEWPYWLRAADIEWCRVEITENGGVVWLGGEWRGGGWHGGTWHGGIWHGGVWYYGVWHDGTWFAGQWHDGKAWRTDGPPGSGGEA